MQNKIIKSAKTFLRKELRYEVSFESITSYLHRTGYVLVFYDPEKSNDLIESVGLSAYSKTVHAFTIRYKGTNAVFIDSSIPLQDKLTSLLHETAHIYLNHLDEDKLVTDDRMQEMQAEAFAYTVLNHKQTPKAFLLLSVISALMIIASATFATQHLNYTPETVSEETVHITKTGEKFHRSTCVYVQNKDCTEVSRAQAEKLFDPCLVCNP